MSNLPLRPFGITVAGTSMRKAALLACTQGDYLEVRAEPDNPEDPNAIGLWHDQDEGTVQVGWVPRHLAQRMDAGEWDAVITRVNRHWGQPQGLQVRLFPKGEPELPGVEP